MKTLQRGAATPAVDTWSCPTTVHAAPGALAHLARLVGSQRSILLTDSVLTDTTALMDRLREGVPQAHQVVRQASTCDSAFLAEALDAMQRFPDRCVIACGGGSVLDVARIAALAHTDPAFAARLPGAMAAGGLFMWPASTTRSSPVICIPTTLGTASEVSPVAILHGNSGSLLAVSPALRPQTAILDPDATASLPTWRLNAGLLEPLARVLVPSMTGTALTLQDALASALCQTLMTLGDEAVAQTPDASWRLTAALASAQTHTAFLALGRSPFGHALWPLATEIMAACGVTKAAALQRLLPAWLTGLASARLGTAFGCSDRAPTLLGTDAATAAQRMAAWLDRTQAPAPVRAIDATAVAKQVQRNWQQQGLFLPGASLEELRWLLTAATATSQL